ncbi:MAG: DUF3310 domain-containing protein [Planctomycetes bacterium]|nr:DUF3310 domain-containing protein [Planctomycetota bacterium]
MSDQFEDLDTDDEIQRWIYASRKRVGETVREALTTKPKEAVDHPAHYNAGNIEVIDAIEEWGLGFCDGNVVKYVARHRHKNGLEDLKKARWYLNRLISNMEKEANGSQVQVNS